MNKEEGPGRVADRNSTANILIPQQGALGFAAQAIKVD